MRTFWRRLRHAVWPYAQRRQEWPKAADPGPATPIVLEHARDLLARQSASYDALDGKAATIIGAIFVVLGLVLPNVSARDAVECAAFGFFLAVVAYGLAVSFKAYSVTKLSVGVTPAHVAQATAVPEATVRGAMAVHLLRNWVANEPAIERKAAFVLRALVALIIAVVPLAILAIAGALR